MKALVTGGGGFLGGAIVRHLVEDGYEVISYSRGRYSLLEKLGVKHIQGDLSDRGALSMAAAGCDVVFHVAAKAGIWGPYEEYYKANVEGTINVLRACKNAGVRRLVYTSSPSVVFNGSNMEGVDESVPYGNHSESNYSATKAIAEKMVLNANGKELLTVALRPHLIWGPGDNNLLPKLADKARTGRLRIVGTGKNLIDFVYVDNAAKAHLQAAKHLNPGSPVAGKAYFLSNGDPRPMAEIINMVMKAYGLPAITQRIPTWIAYCVAGLCEVMYRSLKLKGEPLMTRFMARELASAHWFDISAARRDFGYDPEISFDEGYQMLREALAS